MSDAVAWLTAAVPGGPWLLASIDPTQPNPTVRAIHITEPTDLLAYITDLDTKVNLYWMPNATAPNLTTTPTKTQITGIRWLYADLDLPRDQPHDEEHKAPLLARCRALTPPPTAIVDSGGGYQPGWRIDPPYPPTYLDRIEATGKALAHALGSDAVQNVNRWLRLPGTLNIPNASKRARGRVPTRSQVVEVDWSRSWSYDDPVPHLPDGYDEPRPLSHTFADLPAKWRRLVRSGDASDYDDDRSRLTFALIAALIARSWADEEIMPFLTDERYGSAQHCRSKPDPDDTARRQIARARERGGDRLTLDWDRTHAGTISAASPKNIRIALDRMGIRLTHDTFQDRYFINGAGPLRMLDDPSESAIRLEAHDRFGFLPSKELLADVTVTLARNTGYHPVRDYLSALTHDGTPRVATWLIDLAGAPDTEYTRVTSQLILVAAVRRVRHPGCKFDEMMVFVNPLQGTDKSTAIAVLAVRDDWFTDSFPMSADEKKIIEQLSGKWLVECSDLHGMRHAEVERVKAMLSRRSDLARLAYARHPVLVPRQWIPFGTTNTTAFLADRQNRRFWPHPVLRFNISALAAVRDQLWAEAAAIEATGVSIRLPPHLWEQAAIHQEEARYGDPWADTLGEHLTGLTGRVAINDVWRILDKPDHQRHPTDAGHLVEAMAEIGWERSVQKFKNVATRCYCRGTAEERRRPLYVFRDPVTRTVQVGPTPIGNDDVPF